MRSAMVSTIEMPMLPPTLRTRLKMPAPSARSSAASVDCA
jgi:hypothetical protein